MVMIPELLTCAVVLLAAVAEYLHVGRCRRVAALAFGPQGRPAPWAHAAPVLRVAAIGAIVWGLATLLDLKPKVHQMGVIPENQYRHLLLVLDVSPSMRLQDAGPSGKQSRAQRTADVLRSFFERAPMTYYKISVIAVFTEAKPVVIDTTDMEVVRNILTDLPMQYAFKKGPTNLFAGLEEAAKMARPWRPRSTTVVVVSDGDTVPATGIPQMPDSVANLLVVGVGDPQTGRFIEGHQSRQDASTLRQVAVRLNGTYHNGNEKHLGSDLVARLSAIPGQGLFEKLTRREYALIAVAAGSAVLALLGQALQWFGSRWRPGTRPRPALVRLPSHAVSSRS